MEGNGLKLTLKNGYLADIAVNQINFNLRDMIGHKSHQDSMIPKPFAEDPSGTQENINHQATEPAS
jgi:hypothetical protein